MTATAIEGMLATATATAAMLGTKAMSIRDGNDRDGNGRRNGNNSSNGIDSGAMATRMEGVTAT